MTAAPAIVILGPGALETARRIQARFDGARVHALAGRAEADLAFAELGPHLRELYARGAPIVALFAAGIAIRCVAPCLADKGAEPPVLAVAEDGSAVVPLLGGLAGANALAREIADALGVAAAITTSGELRFGACMLNPPEGYALADLDAGKRFVSDLLAGESTRVEGDARWLDDVALPRDAHAARVIRVTPHASRGDAHALLIHPRSVVVALGDGDGDNDGEGLRDDARSVSAPDATGRARANAAAPARSVDAYAALADADGKPGAPSAQTALARAGMPPAGADTPASIAASLHAATLPIVRQQLDLLATDQFRWIGEAWPGARLDWTIEPDEQHGRERPAPDADFPDARGWRTRLTLALPSLGTIDAELVLNGEQLAARLRASEAGAARLASHGEALRARLQALGLQVSGLSIRAIDGVPDSFDAAAARAAASAYARAAAGGEAAAKERFGGAAGATGEAGGAGVEHRASSSSPVEADDDWEFAR
ncbi:flagellar hook-length control protein FliK [Burkholderia pseudomallei]|uniref:flagellar hook-length control protein FliK n=1 Tax=Burkholderia pseudomallei TaxID=28450 RepID=UPI0011B9D5B4|nr:flagellar hook-length control protein FliK [Burkholderia pseudomallei]MEB5494259.1 flagellar hook-length control protein FliK [Burkholderia pseudomallei]MEB5513736.1 flagellar hook-length control protein FliK [Burkholderia pseudomallei]TXD00315.1 flagellar hook-length control protein FliK [Burkholderia pseudomallei]